MSDSSSWTVAGTRACGCEIIYDVDSDRTSLRHTGKCIYHLCRICGNVPLADAEPDVLCCECESLSPFYARLANNPEAQPLDERALLDHITAAYGLLNNLFGGEARDAQTELALAIDLLGGTGVSTWRRDRN